MYNSHVNDRGWDNIGQHVSLFPDGKFVTGRPFNSTPAGISGYNTGAFMTEMVGDFDKGKDKLEGKQLEAMLKVQNYLVKNCGATIMFHNEHAPKTCPGTGIDKKLFVKQVMEYGKKPVKPKTIKPYPGEVLKNGMYDNKYVGMVQEKLGIKKDKDFGDITEKYVRAWQKANGLEADGKVGPITWKKMFN
jgi:peptidoglycan hydrolase-like protein with peptidoglycan-binding domain